MDEDKKEEQKKGDIDRSKLEADIRACRQTASAVRTSSSAGQFCSSRTPLLLFDAVW